MASEIDTPAGLSSYRAVEAQTAVMLHRRQLARLIFQLDQFAVELSRETQFAQVGLLALERKLNQILMSYLQTAELIAEVVHLSHSKDAVVIREVKEHLRTYFLDARGTLRDSISTEGDQEGERSERRFLTLMHSLLHPTEAGERQQPLGLCDAYTRTREVADYLRSLLATLILEPDQKIAPRLPRTSPVQSRRR